MEECQEKLTHDKGW